MSQRKAVEALNKLRNQRGFPPAKAKVGAGSAAVTGLLQLADSDGIGIPQMP